MRFLGMDVPDWLKVIGGLITAIAAAALAAWLTSKRYERERADEQQTLLSALFGELAHVLEHYWYAASELPHGAADRRELQKRLTWSEFGELRSTSEVAHYGFLDAGQVRLLLQLGLRIRNTDSLLTILRADMSAINDSELRHLRTRMDYVRQTSATLLESLVRERPALQNVLTAVQESLAG